MNALRRRPLFAWIALLAITLAALMPTVSRALARGSASPVSWTEVCTASGVQRVKLDRSEIIEDAKSTVSSEPGGNLPAHKPLDHCPLCLLAADRLGPAPATPARLAVPGDPVAPAIGPQAGFRSLAPLAAHARGPPLKTSPTSSA